MMVNNNNSKVPLKYVINYIKKSKNLNNHIMKAYCYVGYHLYKNKDKSGNVAVLEHDIQPFIKKGFVDEKRFDKFSMHLNRFTASLLPRKKIEKYMKKHLKIIERQPHGNTFVEKAFYWQYVMKRK